MEKKINIAELLKNCPKGMELDCILYDNIYFDTVEHNSIKCYIQNKGYRTSVTFDVYGGLIDSIPTKCVIFPKGKTTWEGFQRPFKDGDIVATSLGSQVFILQRMKSNTTGYCYMGYNFRSNSFFNANEWSFERLATEEEKEKLFKAIKENGYKWNPETKTLEKLPKFKVGNKIVEKDNPFKYWYVQGIDTYCNSDFYYIVTKGQVSNLHFKDQDNWELVPNKFDITTLKVFDKVLVRDSNESMWSASIFSHTWKNKYICVGIWYNQCIPYEENKHLLGTTDDCDEYYKTWE